MSKISPPSLSAVAPQAADPFRLLVESVVDYAIYMVDPNGIITTWNSGAARIFGFEADEVLGRHRNMLFTAEDVAAGAVQAEQDRAAAQGSVSEER